MKSSALPKNSPHPGTKSIEIRLLESSSQAWLDTVLADFDQFIKDHAACERKASATGINFVVQYPDRAELVDAMIRLAREELMHFHQVSKLATRRGIVLQGDEKDPYVNSLLDCLRNGREQRLLDRLLAFGIIEARGCERFGLVGQALKDKELSRFYQRLAKSEARHHQMFIELAHKYFETDMIESRLSELLLEERRILSETPLRPAVH